MSKTKKLPRRGRIDIPKRFPMRYQDEVWSLDWTIANFVLPRLRYFRKYPGGHPHGLTEAKWDAILGKMVAAFELAAEGTWLVCDQRGAETVKEGMALFGEYFMHLWN